MLGHSVSASLSIYCVIVDSDGFSASAVNYDLLPVTVLVLVSRLRCNLAHWC